MLRTLALTILLQISIISLAFAQTEEFIQIETNKTLCILSFLETANNAPGVSSSFHKLIQEEVGKDPTFQGIIQAYAGIKLNYQFNKDEYPQNRHNYREIKDLLWVASANSRDIDDFSQRIVGMLPNSSHQALIDAMKQVEPFYDELVWEKEQAHIRRMEEQLTPFKKKIEELFLTVSSFYRANWSKQIPFKIMLYPIPLAEGNTTAIPKGNALICSFLSHKEDDYEGILGVIVHEMCHILYDEQSIEFQQEIDNWFTESPSEWSKLSYSYLDEGLATAVGNGWAQKELSGKLDTTDWYNNPYIDGFAHAMYDKATKYLDAGKEMDESFIRQAIASFENTFPDATRELDLLMNEVVMLANSEDKKGVNYIAVETRKEFDIRSRWLSTPITDPGSQKYLEKEQVTKFFIVEKDHAVSLDFIKSSFPDLSIEFNPDENFYYSFKDQQGKCAIIILNLQELDDLGTGIQALKKSQYLKFGELMKF